MTKNGKVGIGIIGFGGIAQAAHAPGYRSIPDECEILAVADITPERLVQAQGPQWNIPHAFEDYRKLLEMPEIDAVSVCTPNYAHQQPARDALAAGKHVLCEKPMAMNATEATAMVQAAAQYGKQLQIGYNWRFASGAQSLRRSIDAGKLGDVYYARAQALRRRGVPGWGVFTQKDKQGGGPLIDIGVHITDLTLYFMSHKKPVAASGKTYTKFGTREGVIGTMGTWDPKIYTVEDFAVGLIRFEDGSTMTLESSFIANLQNDVFSTHLFGTEGGALFDMGNYTLYREEFGTLTDTKPGWLPSVGSTHGEEVKVFVRAVRDNLPVESLGAANGEQGLMVTQIMDALYASSETGTEVAIG
jgi:predicted dehydrogenase